MCERFVGEGLCMIYGKLSVGSEKVAWVEVGVVDGSVVR